MDVNKTWEVRYVYYTQRKHVKLVRIAHTNTKRTLIVRKTMEYSTTLNMATCIKSTAITMNRENVRHLHINQGLAQPV